MAKATQKNPVLKQQQKQQQQFSNYLFFFLKKLYTLQNNYLFIFLVMTFSNLQVTQVGYQHWYNVLLLF